MPKSASKAKKSTSESQASGATISKRKPLEEPPQAEPPTTQAVEIADASAVAQNISNLDDTTEVEAATPVESVPDVSDTGPELPLGQIPALARRMEALLFVSPKPLAARRIAELLGLTSIVPVRQAAGHLKAACAGHAFELRDMAGGYQLMTIPDVESDVLKLQRQKKAQQMTTGALETLAVIAYKQPMTRSELDAIRGISSDHHIRTLLERDLIRVVGRRTDGKFGGGAPVLYGTTTAFLNEFGLGSLSELPSADTLADDDAGECSSERAREIEQEAAGFGAASGSADGHSSPA